MSQFVTYVDAAHRSGAISVSSIQLMIFKATFFILTAIGVMWLTAVGAVVFSLSAFNAGNERPSSVANGSVYMSAFFLSVVVTIAIIAPGILLLQPLHLRSVLWRERQAITPRQRFRGEHLSDVHTVNKLTCHPALYPRIYDPTYATGCCILAIVLACTFSLIFPLIGPAVVILLFLTIIGE